jgi:hypothetical protein
MCDEGNDPLSSADRFSSKPNLVDTGRAAAPASVDGIALDERLVEVDGDRDSIPGIPAVVQVIAVPEVVDIHIIVLVPVV